MTAEPVQVAEVAPRLRDAVEALAEGFALFGGDDQLIFSNSRFRDSYRPLAHLISPGLNWRMFLSEARRHGLDQGLNEVDSHLAVGGDSPYSTDGARPGDRWVRIRFHPLDDGSFVLTETDITSAKTAETMRSEAEDLLRKVLDACAANLMMCRVGSGEIIYRTPAWISLFGSALSARDVYADPADRSDFLADLLAADTVDNFDTRLRRADGTIFPARISARLVEFRGEELVVSLTQDMTQLYRQRDEIARLNQRLIDAIEALDQGFVLFDPEDRLIVANRVWNNVNFELADLAKSGVENDRLIAAARGKDLQTAAVGWDRDATPDTARRFEFAFHDGREFEGTRQTTSDGGFVLAWRDVTQQKAAARALEAQREASFQTEKLTALGETLAGVAHELNNPLSVVVGQALMLREEVGNGDTLRRVERIAKAAERCSKIVKTFLAMARERPANMEAIDLNEIVETAIDVAAYSLRAGGTDVTADLATDLPPVTGDGDQLAQVFVNLLVNAEQALADRNDGKLQVTTQMTERQIVALVEDNGPGIPPEARARVFEPFFTTKDIGEGTGVGLALAARIITAHGGSIRASKSRFGGAAFEIRLPLGEAQAAPERRDMSNPAGAGLRALVIDDDVPIAELVADLLGRIGIEATTATSGPDALTRLSQDRNWDLILSDLRMPGVSGLGLRSEIAGAYPELLPRLAFMTGDSMSRDADALRTEGRHPVLEKPILPADLHALVRKIVGSA